MYGLIVKMTIVPGKRNEMIDLLKSSASDMPGCFSYVVAEDSADEKHSMGDGGVGHRRES